MIRLVVAAAQGDATATQQIAPFLQQLGDSPDWERLASVLQRVVEGERNPTQLARDLDATDQIVLAATLALLA